MDAGGRMIHGAAMVFVVILLAACSGGTGGNAAVAPAAPRRGALLRDPPQRTATLTAVDLLRTLGAPANLSLLALSGTPLCDILVYHLEYRTEGGRNEATTASGALMVPSGVNADCRGARPMLLYAHGTATLRAFDIGDLQNADNAEGLLLAAVFAAQGYIVVAPNYAGYDSSTLPYHAYLNADQQSKDMIDALSAARSGMATAGLQLTRDSGRLFITGYSQGGYVALATERAMQSANMPVTAVAPMSGPYALAAFFDMVAGGEVNGGAPVHTTLLVASYQQSYGNVYASSRELFEAQYAPGIETLLPGTAARSELYAQGNLPQYALFSSTPPAPLYAGITPATQPSLLASVFAQGFGTGNLLTNDFRLRYLHDAEVHQDGGWPVATTQGAASGSELGWRQALVRNDLRTFTPSAPTLLCGGSGDPVVYWFNTQLIMRYWAAHPAAVDTVSVLDLEAPAVAGDAYGDLKGKFTAARNLVASDAVLHGAGDGGRAAVFDAYHTTLVAPFCLAAVRQYFGNR
jgi:Prolyl oligopeptidase family